jgi:hypothetical protein
VLKRRFASNNNNMHVRDTTEMMMVVGGAGGGELPTNSRNRMSLAMQSAVIQGLGVGASTTTKNNKIRFPSHMPREEDSSGRGGGLGGENFHEDERERLRSLESFVVMAEGPLVV